MNRNPSQAAVILQHLQNGATLTALDALELFGCLRLAARVHELKKQGWAIAERKVEFSNGKKSSQYYMA